MQRLNLCKVHLSDQVKAGHYGKRQVYLQQKVLEFLVFIQQLVYRHMQQKRKRS